MTGPSVYNADARNRYPCDDDILADAPENPVRFLSESELAWKGMVDGIDDLARLEAYRQAEKRHIKRNSSKAKVNVHKYLDDRERELRGESITAEPTPETTPATATDGGQTLESPTEPEGSNEPDTIHPGAEGLEVGQVLVVTRGDSTEFVWPQTDAADEPFILRLFDAEDDQQMELTPSQRDLFSRSRDHDSKKRPVAEIDKRAPKLAATNRGDSE